MAMPQNPAWIPLSKARAQIDLSLNYEVLRRAIERFGIQEKDERGQRLVPIALVKAFKASREASGYLYPKSVRTVDDLLAMNSDVT
jgi:hypothetical protein